MSEYKLTSNPDVVERTADHAYIPNNPNNPDWQAYQTWLDAGGVPDPLPIIIGASAFDWGPHFVEVIGRY